MLRKLGLVALGLILVAAGMTAAGFRIERGGSGWPRFIVHSNEAALEADRAQQKNLAPGQSASALGATADRPDAPPAPDASTSAPASQIATVDRPNAAS